MDFELAEQNYVRLEKLRRSGQISEDEYRTSVQAIRVLDDRNRWWMVQEQTGQWFVWGGGAWYPEARPGGAGVIRVAAPQTAAPQTLPPQTAAPRCGGRRAARGAGTAAAAGLRRAAHSNWIYSGATASGGLSAAAGLPAGSALQPTYAQPYGQPQATPLQSAVADSAAADGGAAALCSRLSTGLSTARRGAGGAGRLCDPAGGAAQSRSGAQAARMPQRDL